MHSAKIGFLTIEYTDQYITDGKNHSCATFIFLDQQLVNQFPFTGLQYAWSAYYPYTCNALNPISLPDFIAFRLIIQFAYPANGSLSLSSVSNLFRGL